MDSILIQKQVKDNAEDLQFYIKDLTNWEEEMKRKESNLISQSDSTDTKNLPPVRSKKFKKTSQQSQQKAERILSGDYEAWSKFDVEAACKEIDKEKDTDECEESVDILTEQEILRRKDEAYIAKDKGNTFVKDQKWAEAIESYTTAINLYADDTVFYANRALCYLKLQKFKNAEIDCTNALRLEPNYVKALQRRAAAKTALDQLIEAHQDLKRILELEPNNKQSHSELIKLEAKLNTPNKTQRVAHEVKPDVKLDEPKTILKKPEQALIEEVLIRPAKTETQKTYTPDEQKTVLKEWKETSIIEKNKLLDDELEKTWGSSTKHVLIEPINKLPHLRSKKPLKRIPIEEVDIPNSKSSIKKEKPVTEVVETTTALEDPQIEIIVPKTCLQFTNIWQQLGTNHERKFKFLQKISPSDLPDIFQEFLESDLFCDILTILAEFSLKPHQQFLFNYLVGLMNVKRFATIIMFMDKNNKNQVVKIINFLEETGELEQHHIDNLKRHYNA